MAVVVAMVFFTLAPISCTGEKDTEIPSIETAKSTRPPEPRFDVGLEAQSDSAPDPATFQAPGWQSTRSSHEELLDPRSDGWLTEALTERVYEQLAPLAASIENAHDSADTVKSGVSRIVTTTFSCTALRPESLSTTLEDGEFTVRRSSEGSRNNDLHRGNDGLARAIKSLSSPWKGATEVHVKFKVFRLDLTYSSDTSVLNTQAFYTAWARTSEGRLQQNATWHCRWTLADNRLKDQSSDSALPRLTHIEVHNFEEVVRPVTDGNPLFADCTESVLGQCPSFHRQILRGTNHWLARVEAAHGMEVFALEGMALGDINGDGLDDVYLCQPGGLPNRLYVQQLDGTCLDQSRTAAVDWLDKTVSALFVDLDNDGDQDLISAVPTTLLVMENDGSGRFNLRSELPTQSLHVQSLSAIDYDNDSLLDLYICNAFANRQERRERPEFVYYDANDAARNFLYRNEISDTQWKFRDVTSESGLDDEANHRHSLAAAWEDFDNDADLDLYVANDYGRNCLYRNDAGHFQDVAENAEVVDHGSGMSVSWADYNRDGRMDLYVGNMFSSAGNRVTRQSAFMQEQDPAVRSLYQRFAKGNTLFENTGGGKFREVLDSGAEMGRWAWSSVFVDINNDGWEDLVVANGYITTEDTGDL